MTGVRGDFPARRLNVTIDGGDVALLRFGRAGAPPLLFAHANGFCASAYRRMFEEMGQAFDIFAVDLRGHGRTRLQARAEGHRSMAVFGEDLRRTKAALASFAPGAKWVLAGHSLGGVAVAKAAACDEAVAAIRLIEPVAMPRGWNLIARSPLWPLIAPRISLVRSASRRRARWPDQGAAHKSYAGKPFFAGWADGVLADYLEDGLTPEDNAVRLSCAPEWEAANFAAQASGLWDALAEAKAPVSVLAARHSSSTLRGGAAAQFRRLGADVERISGVTHLIPFEAPALAAKFLTAAAR